MSQQLKEQMRSLALKAQSVVDDAERPTSEKREELDKIEADIKSISEKITDEDYLIEQRKKYAGLAQPERAEDDRAAGKSWGEQFVSSERYGLREKGSRFTTGAVELKATITGTASPVVQPDVRPGVVTINFQRPTVADLMPNGQTTSNTVRYLQETTATNAAAAVAEEGLKPESTLILSEVDEPVRKIATILRVTDEMYDDVAQMRSYIDSRGRLFIQLEEEDQLLNGSGVAPNLTGLRNRTGMQVDQALGTDTRPDAIYKQITNIRTNAFLEPDGIVVHPADWQDIRLAKDANNQYYGGGPFTGAYGNGTMAPDSLWGLRVIITTAITSGTALVGAFGSAAQVFRKGGITVEATNSDGEDFRYNRIAIRFEERLALAVYRPAAFGEVTGL